MKRFDIKFVTLSFLFTVLGCDSSQKAILDTEGLDQNGVHYGEQVLTDTPSSVSTVSIGISIDSEPPRGICTGVIIAEDLILTAAHCVFPDFPTFVGFGKNGSDSFRSPDFEFQPILVKESRIHPVYIKKSITRVSYDLAILKLSKKVPASRRISTLATKNFELTDPNLILEIIGYGKDHTKDENSADNLNRKEMKIADLRSEVDLQMKGYIFRPGKTILIAQPEGGTCHGDSGGPLFAIGQYGSRTLVGIASAVTSPGKPTPTCDAYSIYTDIRKHLNWIEQVKKELSQETEASLD